MLWGAPLSICLNILTDALRFDIVVPRRYRVYRLYFFADAETTGDEKRRVATGPIRLYRSVRRDLERSISVRYVIYKRAWPINVKNNNLGRCVSYGRLCRITPRPRRCQTTASDNAYFLFGAKRRPEPHVAGVGIFGRSASRVEVKETCARVWNYTKRTTVIIIIILLYYYYVLLRNDA